MIKRRMVTIGVGAALASLIALAVVIALYVRRRSGGNEAPRPGDKIYAEVVSAFYSGVAALDVDARDRAKTELSRAAELFAGEPAVWADLGLLELRVGDHQAAARNLEKAAKLAPESGAIERLLGLLESRNGQYALAIAHFRRAVALNPDDLKSRFSLLHEVERSGEPDSESVALEIAGELVERARESLPALLERARLAAKRGDGAALGGSVARLLELKSSWPKRAQQLALELEQDAKSRPASVARGILQLRNVLLPTPEFQKSWAAIETPMAAVGEPISSFMILTQPPPTPSPPDETISYAVNDVEPSNPERSAAVAAVPLSQGEPPFAFVTDGRTLRRVGGGPSFPFPGGSASQAPVHGILAVDLNSDYRMDFVLAGAGGLKVYLQKEEATFADATAATGLSALVLSSEYSGVWAADLEMDGDLDLVLGTTRDVSVTVLRNNGDGTFAAIQPFEGANGLRDFAWADLDQDGDPDATILDSHFALRIFTNERAGRFQLQPAPDGIGTVIALAVADLYNDGAMDVLVLKKAGMIARATAVDGGRSWETADVTPSAAYLESPARLFVADLDNNGALDLIASAQAGGWIGLSDQSGRFRSVPYPVGLYVLDVVDFNADGRLDLVGLFQGGRPSTCLGRGSKNYHWLVIRPRGARVFGDGRINSFGLGGEVEVRSGLLVQKQVVGGPVLHFGLGDRGQADVARIVWPNGTFQVEFDAKADQVLAAEQRLKGSCPFLFAFDGTAVRFVTDFIWRSPLGLRINAQETAGVGQTEDWVKIRGDQLAPREGAYDVRITAELWETHYFDHVSLMAVDHPSGTEVFVDERFARQPPPLVVHPTGPLHPFASAWDDQGRDVLEDVAVRDGRYLDGFGRGAYQGITRDHWVELEIGEDVDEGRPLWLVASGWIHPTDSSINVAIGQRGEPKPQGLSLEIPSGDGGWKVARADLGFPAGKNKTILVDLNGIVGKGANRQFRLRTNLEIFWDSLAVAEVRRDADMKTQRLAAFSAKLRPRGYSLMTQASTSSPELPHYDSITGTQQRWRDLIGFYTRFGDVRELLAKVDDRYVIANAGDELALRFPALPSPQAGWVRDFVLIGDGWNKDGDFNTAFSKTVLPLPSHSRPGYDGPAGALEDDPVFRFHPEDWREYHTRWVTSGEFQGGVRPRVGVSP